MDKYSNISFRGISSEPINDQTVDGMCEDIINLKPKGTDEQPYWVPFERILPLANSEGVNFSYTHGIESIKAAFWQIRNFIGDYALSQDQSLKRLIVLCQNEERNAIDILDPFDWSIVASQELPEGDYRMSCTRMGEITVVNIVRDNNPYILYYVQDDLFVQQGWPQMPKIKFTTYNKSFEEEEVQAGNTEGIQREDNKQWFLVRWAFRLYDGTYVKHSIPILQEVSSGSAYSFLIPRFELVGYETPPIEFWKGVIAGVSIACSLPKRTEKEALDDGVFFEVGFWSFIDRRPMEEWPTEENPNIIDVTLPAITWPTQRDLNIDNFTHHRFSGNVVDTYNSRLLLGGIGIDFSLPDVEVGTTSSGSEGNIDFILTGESTGESMSQTYDDDWNPVDPSQWTSNNEILTETGTGTYSPLAGKEFKEVVITEAPAIVPGSGPIGYPGPDPNPEAFHSVSINEDGELVVEMTYELAFGVSGQLGAPNYFLRLKLTVGDIGTNENNVEYEFKIEMVPDGLSGNPRPTKFIFSEVIDYNAGEESDYILYHIVTLKTDVGTFKRIAEVLFTMSGSVIELPEILAYPDRRAIKYELLVKNVDEYETVFVKELIQHPSDNYSYSRLHNSERTYTLGSSAIITDTPPDLSVNLKYSYARNKGMASVTNQPFIFDVATTFKVGNRENDTIQAFAVNAMDISSGQYGQYPLYVLSDKSAWALEQTSDPSIAFGSITPVNNFNGTENPDAVCNTSDQNIIAADRNYIYILQGQNANRIDRAISQTPNYEQYLKGIKLAFHKTPDYEEVICSNPAFNFSWIYNIRYNVWYRGSETFRHFFQDQPYILGITKDNVVKDFNSKDPYQGVSWSIRTRPWNFGSKYVLKKLLKSMIRARFQQVHQENPDDYISMTVRVRGWKEAQEHPYDVVYYLTKEEISKDLWLINRFGAFNAFSIELSGNSQQEGSYLHIAEITHETRYETRIRR